MSAPVQNGRSASARSDGHNERLLSGLQMTEQAPDDVRVNVSEEPVADRQEIRSSAPVDEENQNGPMDRNVDATSPLLSPGNGGGNGGGTAEQGPVADRQEIRSSAPVDEENQNGPMDRNVDATSPLLSPGNGEGNGGGTVEQGPEHENLAEMEINSLIWVKKKGNEVFREALETWQTKDALFASRVDKKRKQSSSLMNEIYQLVGFYSVFQGVLLTAVAQSNYLTCYNWWTAFCLSLLASLVTVGGVIQKFRSVISLEETIASEGYSRMVCINRANKLLQKRENFSFKDDAKEYAARRSPPKQTKLWVSSVVVVFILLLFSSLFLASVYRILCDSGIPGPAAAPSPR